jgi:hypothetical protein
VLILCSQKFKPNPEYPALDEFAHSSKPLSQPTSEKLIEELRAMGIPLEGFLTAGRVGMLKQGLLKAWSGATAIDGPRYPYQLLLPFLTLGCHHIYNVTGVGETVDEDNDVVAIMTLSAASAVVSTIEIQNKLGG